MSTLPPGAVRVPWVVGTTATAAPVELTPAPTRKVRCEAKAVRVREDLAAGRAAVERISEPRIREELQSRSDFQARRVAWIEAAARASTATLAARRRKLEAELGSDADYLDTGLPPRMAGDQRLMDLLGELAIVRFALGE